MHEPEIKKAKQTNNLSGYILKISMIFVNYTSIDLAKQYCTGSFHSNKKLFFSSFVPRKTKEMLGAGGSCL
jgi:hypothetical protein